MDLWIHWYSAIRQLRPGFSRELTFLWFALSVAGLSVRSDKLSNRDKRTLLDKALLQLSGLKIAEPCYPVADAYYASGKIVKGVLAQKHELITRCKSNCVAYRQPIEPKKPKRGRPRK